MFKFNFYLVYSNGTIAQTFNKPNYIYESNYILKCLRYFSKDTGIKIVKVEDWLKGYHVYCEVGTQEVVFYVEAENK